MENLSWRRLGSAVGISKIRKVWCPKFQLSVPHVVDLQDNKSTNSKSEKDLLDTVDLVPTQRCAVEPNLQSEAPLDADGSP